MAALKARFSASGQNAIPPIDRLNKDMEALHMATRTIQATREAGPLPQKVTAQQDPPRAARARHTPCDSYDLVQRDLTLEKARGDSAASRSLVLLILSF
jgi:hypothetical protein